MVENRMIVGLAGKAGAGKDTVGYWFINTYGFKSYAFASRLKAGMAAMGFPEPADRKMKEELVPGFNFTWRDAAQKLGTEWGRNLESEIWLKLGKQYIENCGDSVVITDVRFEDEAAMIRKLGGTIIHLQGRGAGLGSMSNHASEAGIKVLPCDFVVDNSGTLADTFEQLEGFMNV